MGRARCGAREAAAESRERCAEVVDEVKGVVFRGSRGDERTALE